MEKILFDYIGSNISLSEDEKQIIKDLSLIQAYKKGYVLLDDYFKAS